MNEDEQALAALSATGLDLSKPLTFEFPIDVDTEEKGQELLRAIRDEGYSAELEYDEGEEDEEHQGEGFAAGWTIYVSISLLPTASNLIRTQQRLSGLAKPFGAISDSWGVLA